MISSEAFSHDADVITQWQLAAQQVPLPELRAVVDTCQERLAEALDAFNDIYLSCDGDTQSAGVVRAATEVTVRATATAILTLGITCRTYVTAHQN